MEPGGGKCVDAGFLRGQAFVEAVIAFRVRSPFDH
jgi:hypothetical protein